MNQDSVLAEKCWRGEALTDELVIDMHAHLGPWLAFPVVDDGSVESLVRQMDLVGIDCTLVSPHVAIGPDWQEGNRQAYQAHKQFPDRVRPYFTPNPKYPWAQMEVEIDRWRGEGVLAGFKLHPAVHGYATTDDLCVPIYEYANEHSIPILSHEWNGEKVDDQHPMRGLAQRYPNVAFIHAHSANGWDVMETLTEAAAGQENIYLDITGSVMYYGLLEEMVNRIGAEHVLFGTDMPFLDGRAQVGRILTSRLTDDQKRLILGRNAARVFGLFGL